MSQDSHTCMRTLGRALRAQPWNLRSQLGALAQGPASLWGWAVPEPGLWPLCENRGVPRSCSNKGLSSQGYGFSSGHVWMWESWALKNWCFWTMVLEKTVESPLDRKEIQPVHPKQDQSWVFIGRTDAEAETPNTLVTWCKELTHLKRPWCWEWLRAVGEGDDRVCDGWMASLTQWTWVWVDSGSWWWTGRPGVLWFMGSQRVGHYRAINWTELNIYRFSLENLLDEVNIWCMKLVLSF